MKKYYILTAALALVACSKVSPVDEAPAAKTITISATLSNVATKVSFDAAFDANGKPTGMSHTWEAGDQLLVTDSSNPSVSAVFDAMEKPRRIWLSMTPELPRAPFSAPRAAALDTSATLEIPSTPFRFTLTGQLSSPLPSAPQATPQPEDMKKV